MTPVFYGQVEWPLNALLPTISNACPVSALRYCNEWLNCHNEPMKNVTVAVLRMFVSNEKFYDKKKAKSGVLELVS